ncbi:Cytochrome P450 86B1 [Morella rubra]|uniref:Cytochrome P450 86B1 n=1 Tax=Morella rubra TaxID=262757 RepID=A0A6A1V8V2_9ROSI|nr:Cytochrome P450 86B1 [Morella rubra]
MDMLWYAEIFLAFLCFLFLFHWGWNYHLPIINWPVVGMLPGLLWNAEDVHNFSTRLLKCFGGTVEFWGPWFTNMNFVITSDPANIHHIFSRNFSNYEKGPEFREIFEALGDGIFNADSDSWKLQRKLIQSLIKNNQFEVLLKKVVQEKVQKGLVPVLDHVSRLGIEVDLQDVFQRFTFDNICLMVLGFDANCLAVEFPKVEYEKAFDQIEESVFYRHFIPESIWKLQRWLQIGEEKKLTDAWKVFDQFVYQCISSKREELSRSKTQELEKAKFDLLTAYIEGGEMGDFPKSNKFVRDTAFNLMLAGRDTVSAGLTWLLWLVATHPVVEAKILEEIRGNLLLNNEIKWGINELSELVYLHGAICESLRLFPSVPFEHKYAVQSDTLPSGHSIRPRTRLLFSLYSMGRMESIWGEDCLDFKPERWISERGRIVHVPSYKFIAFNAGPRTCLGKDMSFIQMKMVASTIIWNYHVQVVEDHPVLPSLSIVLHMKHGLKNNLWACLIHTIRKFVPFVALLLDGVWFLRNRVVQKGAKPEPTILIQDLQRRTACGIHFCMAGSYCHGIKTLATSPVVCIKINVDVAVRKHFVIIAAVCKFSWAYYKKSGQNDFPAGRR